MVAGGERVRRNTDRGRSDDRGHHGRDRVPGNDIEHDERDVAGDIDEREHEREYEHDFGGSDDVVHGSDAIDGHHIARLRCDVGR